jgi:hypothetical protein
MYVESVALCGSVIAVALPDLLEKRAAHSAPWPHRDGAGDIPPTPRAPCMQSSITPEKESAMLVSASPTGEVWRPVPDACRPSLRVACTVNARILRNLARTSLDMIGRMLAFTNKVYYLNKTLVRFLRSMRTV